MIVLEFTLAAVVASGVTALTVLLTRRAGRRTGLLWLFLLLFLAAWAGGVWIRPLGPDVWGIHWLGFLLAGLLVALALVATGSPKAPRGRHETLDLLEEVEREKALEESAYITLSLFYWVLLLFLAAAVIGRYVV
jgi:hypothetical protein